MGRYPGEQSSSDWEAPQHTVTIGYNLYMGKYEVTKAQWLAMMGTSPWSGEYGVHYNPYSPAVYVSWNDIAGTGGFMEKLNQHLTATGQDGAHVRLPSESEWEYACRAGTTTRFYWGDDPFYTQIGAYAWYDGNTYYSDEKYAHVVGQKLPNAWGLYDMIGNVWEWCQDWIHDGYTGAPVDGSAWLTPTSGLRLYRGGGWHCGFLDQPSMYRSAYRGSSASPGSRSETKGFRVARAP